MEELTKVTVSFVDGTSEFAYYTDRQKALDFVDNPFHEDWFSYSAMDKEITNVFANEVEVSVGGWLVQGKFLKQNSKLWERYY